MPLRKDNRSPSQVTRDFGGGVAAMGGERYYGQSVTAGAQEQHDGEEAPFVDLGSGVGANTTAP
jgi:hypothetical protein